MRIDVAVNLVRVIHTEHLVEGTPVIHFSRRGVRKPGLVPVLKRTDQIHIGEVVESNARHISRIEGGCPCCDGFRIVPGAEQGPHEPGLSWFESREVLWLGPVEVSAGDLLLPGLNTQALSRGGDDDPIALREVGPHDMCKIWRDFLRRHPACIEGGLK